MKIYVCSDIQLPNKERCVIPFLKHNQMLFKWKILLKKIIIKHYLNKNLYMGSWFWAHGFEPMVFSIFVYNKLYIYVLCHNWGMEIHKGFMGLYKVRDV